MDKLKNRALLGFYENELCNNILPFWLDKSIDKENGGFFNCFDNKGIKLLSRDKYTWSQGRFVWLWSKLAMTDCGTFTKAQKSKFMDLAKSGRDFLFEHCLIAPGDFRCVYVMDETGRHKLLPGYDRYDLSISADNFVICGFAKYAEASGDIETYEFCKNLYKSYLERVNSGNYPSLPYPLPPNYTTHSRLMGISNLTREMHFAARILDPGYCPELRDILKEANDGILDHFVDENKNLREYVYSDFSYDENLLCNHMNPGHIIEDMWFMIGAGELLGNDRYIKEACAITLRALQAGWDNEYGGILHFCGINGGKPGGSTEGIANEHMTKLVLNSWDDKLWWIHSEALYTTLLCYEKTGDEKFLEWHDKIFDYTFSFFPNPDRETREWLQILTRDGKPQEKVVALLVKDPFHITRNLILIIELLYSMLEK
ncbi:MAG TPA: hypothetical protein GXX49_08055 [Clostridiaceae bacterium]|nr:hypothetical protein [Clostridiaceae bacterium]